MLAQQKAANNLSSGTYLLNFLLRLWADMTDEEVKILNSTLSPVVSSCDDQVSVCTISATYS